MLMDEMEPMVSSPISGNPVLDKAYSSTSGTVAKYGPDEKLKIARPRSTSNDRTFRGPTAYIKLLTSSDQANLYKSGTANRRSSETGVGDLSSVMKQMASDDLSSGYDEFLLTGVQAGFNEKIQVAETLGDNEVAYFFGRQPMFFTFSGILIDSVDNSWFSKWIEGYAGALRGTKLAQNNELLRLVLPNMTLEGSITSTSWTQDSANDVNIPFSFTFLAKVVLPTPAIGHGKNVTNYGSLLDFNPLESFVTKEQINSAKAQAAVLQKAIQNPFSSVSSIGQAMSGLGGMFGLKGTSSAVSDAIDSITSGVKGALSNASGLFAPIITTLNGIRASLFSPIYGVMTSLSKLVKTVFGTGGFLSILNSLVAPVRSMLRDIVNISTQAESIVRAVTSGTIALGRGVQSGFGIVEDYRRAVSSVKRTKGVIAAMPGTISKTLRYTAKNRGLSNQAAFLQTNPRLGATGASLKSSAVILRSKGASLTKVETKL